MWEQFTDRTSRALFFAYAEAARLGAERVGPEHLLLGLARDRDSVAARVLGRLGLSGGRVRQDLKKRMVAGDKKQAGEMSLDARVTEILHLAQEEGLTLGYTDIGPEHVLLGILREGQSLAARVFADAGIDLDRVRREVVHFVSGGPANPLEIPGWQRFRARARRVVSLAQEEAILRGQELVAPEHLLLGILREGTCLASRVLERTGAPPERVRDALSSQLAAGSLGAVKKIDLDPRTRQVLGLAVEEAWSGGEEDVGTEHLLLGIMREGDGLAARTLGELGVTLEGARRQMVAALSGSASLRTAVRKKLSTSLGRKRTPRKPEGASPQPEAGA